MQFLNDLVIIFGVSAAVVFILGRLNVPTIIGFLIAGVLLGPHGFELVKNVHDVEIFAEIGVILLLFTIGIEFSLSSLVRMRKAVVAGGGIQVFLTIALSGAVFYVFTRNGNVAVFFGFLIALSSTAIIFKLLDEKGETDTPHGRAMIGILIFQDLCVVPMMLLVPSFSGDTINIIDILMKLAKAAALIAVVILSARWIVPNLLHQIVHTKSRELFIISIILLCLGIALLTSRFGLSLALGAFLAGLVISESEYAHQATATMLPFKDSFIGLFFVSVGMLLNVGYMSTNCFMIVVLVLSIFGLKILTGSLSALMTGVPLRTALHTGLGLAQIGEFSFVLASAGKMSGLITEDLYQVFLSSSIITMIATPLMLFLAPSLSERISSLSFMKRFIKPSGRDEAEGFPIKKEGHVIIVGFGLNGRNLATVLKEASVPYVVLDMNIDTVKKMGKSGEPIYYGDGTATGILHYLNISRARMLVIAISDPASTRRVVAIAKQENPDIHIIVRTRYLAEVEDLGSLGADEVIPEEFETSIEIFSRVLHKYNFPNNIILDMVDKIRNDSYTALRSYDFPKRHLFEKCDWLPDIEIDGYRVMDQPNIVGKSIAELQVRKQTGVTIIAVRRASEVYTNPDPDFIIQKDDIILFTGERVRMLAALSYFRGEKS